MTKNSSSSTLKNDQLGEVLLQLPLYSGNAPELYHLVGLHPQPSMQDFGYIFLRDSLS